MPFLATRTAGEQRPPWRAPWGCGDMGVREPQPEAQPAALFPLPGSKADVCKNNLRRCENLTCAGCC